jgi:predicted metal-binding membrane protein
MGPAAHRPEIWLISVSLISWSVLALDGSGLTLPALCSGTPWAVPLSDSFNLALVLNSPAELAAGWFLMLAAMMPPLVIAPLRHVLDRSFAKRRGRATLLFVAGYAAVWMAAGVGLQTMALAVRWATPAPAICLGLAAATALLWQVSPAKQWCLNRCHRRSHLTAFGVAADLDAFNFGLTNGASCAGACWALMLLPLFAGPGRMPGMIAVSLFVFAERLEDAAPLQWCWRGPGKLLRIIAAQARIRLAPRSGIA